MATQEVMTNNKIKYDEFITNGLKNHMIDFMNTSAAATDDVIIKHEIITTTSTSKPDDLDASSRVVHRKIKRRQEPRPFPFSMIIDQEEIKHALLLSAVDPSSIGVLISGGRGTAKSVLARSMERIVPQIQRIAGSAFNIDPDGKYGIDSFLQQRLLEHNDTSIKDLPTELVPCPFVQIPLGCMEDSLIGTVDLEQSLTEGAAHFCPGLLAKSHRG
jgi:Mg-chelatase subunit ChlI